MISSEKQDRQHFGFALSVETPTLSSWEENLLQALEVHFGSQSVQTSLKNVEKND